MKTLAFTGLRPQNLSFKFDETHPDCLKLKSNIKEKVIELIEEGVSEFLSGCALGVDMFCCEIIIALKELYPHIKLIAAVPCKNQDKL